MQCLKYLGSTSVEKVIWSEMMMLVPYEPQEMIVFVSGSFTILKSFCKKGGTLIALLTGLIFLSNPFMLLRHACNVICKFKLS